VRIRKVLRVLPVAFVEAGQHIIEREKALDIRPKKPSNLRIYLTTTQSGVEYSIGGPGHDD
jgi:hypothetical protein